MTVLFCIYYYESQYSNNICHEFI